MQQRVSCHEKDTCQNIIMFQKLSVMLSHGCMCLPERESKPDHSATKHCAAGRQGPGSLQRSQLTLRVCVQEPQGVGGKIHEAAAISLGKCTANRWHGVKQHAQNMRNSEAHIFPPRLPPGLRTRCVRSGMSTSHAAGILCMDMALRR